MMRQRICQIWYNTKKSKLICEKKETKKNKYYIIQENLYQDKCGRYFLYYCEDTPENFNELIIPFTENDAKLFLRENLFKNII